MRWRGAKMLVLSGPRQPGGWVSGERRPGAHRVDRRDGYGVLVYLDESFAAFRIRRSSAVPGHDAVLPGPAHAHGRLCVAGVRPTWHSRRVVRPDRGISFGACQAYDRTFSDRPSTSSPVCQQAAARLLSEPPAPETLDRFRAKRQYALDRLRAMGLEPELPGGGYFAWVSVVGLEMDGRTFAERLLKEARVLVGPGVAFGPSGDAGAFASASPLTMFSTGPRRRAEPHERFCKES